MDEKLTIHTWGTWGGPSPNDISNLEAEIRCLREAGISYIPFYRFELHCSDEQFFDFLKKLDEHYEIERSDEERWNIVKRGY